MKKIIVAGLSVAVLSLGALPAFAAPVNKANVYTNKQYGFSVALPKAPSKYVVYVEKGEKGADEVASIEFYERSKKLKALYLMSRVSVIPNARWVQIVKEEEKKDNDGPWFEKLTNQKIGSTKKYTLVIDGGLSQRDVPEDLNNKQINAVTFVK